MPIQSGTRTYWHELETESEDTVTYVRYGDNAGSPEFLAEALRVDGVIASLGLALRAAETAELELGWSGYLDDGTEVECNVRGESFTGEYVDSVKSCIFARVSIKD